VPLDQGFSTGVPRDVARGSARDRDLKKKINSFFELVGQNKQIHRKLSFSTQKSIDNYYWIIISTTY
jgi:hypothetical protein